MQLESFTYANWFKPDYLRILRGSLAVFDYSARNIAWMRPHLPDVPLFHMPIAPEAPPAIPPAKTCDVLFYGNTSSPRRQKMLAALSEDFDLRIENRLFGPAMHQAITEARVG